MNSQTFDALVGGFYRAATGELPWNDALLAVQAAFSARAVLLHTMDLNTQTLLGLHGGGPNLDEATFNYVRDFHQEDPRRNHALAVGQQYLGQWIHCHEHFDERFVRENHFHQHFLKAYDARYLSHVLLDISGTVITSFAIELPASRGVLNSDERQIAQRLGHHMHDALRAHERVRKLAAQAIAGQGLLQSFPYAMWLIDADRYVAYQNPMADKESKAEARVTQRDQRLVLLRNSSDRQLTIQLQALVHHGSCALIDLRRTQADPPAWLHLSRLEPAQALGVFGAQPRFLATLFDPQQISALDPFALANMFGLTPAEARVAVQVANGDSAEQISESLLSSLATVRVHIKRVNAKLGVARTVDAIRLMRQGEALWSSAGQPNRPGGRS